MTAWLMRVWAWMKAHPRLVAAGLAVAAIFSATARARYYQGKLARRERDEALGKLGDGRETARARDAAAQERRTELDRELDAAGGEVKAGQAEAGEALAERKRIAGKYPPAVLILAVALGFAQARAEPADAPKPVEAPADAACGEDANLSGLLAAVGRTRAHLTGLDAEAVGDLVSVVETYRDERAGLCRAVEGLTRSVNALSESVALGDGLYARCVKDRKACWGELEEKINTPATSGPGRFGWTAGGGLCLGSGGEVTAGLQATWGIRF